LRGRETAGRIHGDRNIGGDNNIGNGGIPTRTFRTRTRYQRLQCTTTLVTLTPTGAIRDLEKRGAGVRRRYARDFEGDHFVDDRISCNITTGISIKIRVMGIIEDECTTMSEFSICLTIGSYKYSNIVLLRACLNLHKKIKCHLLTKSTGKLHVSRRTIWRVVVITGNNGTETNIVGSARRIGFAGGSF